jgi:putative salt-induced outer membrane protein YdiY
MALVVRDIRRTGFPVLLDRLPAMLLLVGSLLIPASVAAQRDPTVPFPVPVAARQDQTDPPPALMGTAEFSLVATTGNSSTQSIGLAGEVTYSPLPWVIDARLAFVRNEANDIVSAKSFSGLVRVSRDLHPRLAAFGQYDYLRNLFAGIDQRHAAAAGVSYLIATTAAHSLKVDVGLGYANEKRLVDPDLSSGFALAGAGYRWKLSETSELAEDVRLVASLSDGADWRVDQTIALTAKLTTLLSLKASNAVHRVNAPAPGFRQTDTITSVALVAKF